MKYDVYEVVEVTEDFNVFDFVSVGSKGVIYKRVAFIKTELENVYNLAFGDLGEDGKINDLSISNNGDRNKILATIAEIIDDYTQKFPDRWIALIGSTDERTRLYRIAIGLNLKELSEKYEIYGYVYERLIPFSKDMKISAFFIKRKIS